MNVSQNSDARILDCVFNGVSNTGFGISLFGALRTKIRGNRISNFHTGICVAGSSLQTQIVQNTVRVNYAGITLAPGISGLSATILSNAISGNSTDGILVTGMQFAGPLTIQANTVSGNGQMGMRLNGTRLPWIAGLRTIW